MSRDRDLELALKLQSQFDEEAVHKIAENDVHVVSTFTPSTITKHDPELGALPLGSGMSRANSRPNEPMSIVDEQWELLDPNPDMRAMFLEFNDKYFWGRLAGVEVRWSPRMTLCAGLCCYEGHGGLCSIRLSSPLLKLRPRKDLVQTLLHEMIHAYLFVTANNKDHDGHGPEFCKHMNRLNQSTGTNITIYHNFHDEVDVYRQHWWRCDGPCQKRPPYNGIVRRAMNRPPSKRDPWWAEHQRSCGGSYTKVKEPDGYGVKKGTKRKKEDADVDGIENETKKRATDMTTTSFPGKGFSLGGNNTTSRLVPPKTVTLDTFLKKVEGGKKSPGQPPLSPPSLPSPSLPSPLRSQDDEEEDGGCQSNWSKNARLRALAAIFDSDDSDDEDIVIVQLDTSLKMDPDGFCEDGDAHDSDSKPGTSQSKHLATKISGPPTNSTFKEHPSVSKTKQINQSGAVSKTKDNSASTSKGNAENHGMKQDSIVDAFNRIRQRSGDCGTKDIPTSRVGATSQRKDGSPMRNTLPATVVRGMNERENGRPPDNEMVDCPVCRRKVAQSKINQHLDQCLS